MNKLSIAFILFVVAILILAQLTDFHLKKIAQSDGLYDDMITCIYQDNKGFIWFGSSRDLIRYEDSDLHVFRHTDDTASLSVKQF